MSGTIKPGMKTMRSNKTNESGTLLKVERMFLLTNRTVNILAAQNCARQSHWETAVTLYPSTVNQEYVQYVGTDCILS